MGESSRVERSTVLPPRPRRERKVSLPPSALLPTRITYADIGIGDLGVESHLGTTVRPGRVSVSR